MPKRIGTENADSIDGTGADDRIIGGGGNDTLMGLGGDDDIAGGEGDDTINGGDGIDTANYGGFDDPTGVLVSLRDGTVAGSDENDTLISIENVSGSQFADDITGDVGDNELNGKAGHDILKGGNGDDVLIGGRGDDTLVGGRGMDTIYGGQGQDILRGGEDADTFFFRSISHTRDVLVQDLELIDFIDFSSIDADATTGDDQAFVLVDDFSGTAGELTVKYSAQKDLTLIRGDVDGDGVKDFQLEIQGDVSDFSNFVL